MSEGFAQGREHYVLSALVGARPITEHPGQVKSRLKSDAKWKQTWWDKCQGIDDADDDDHANSGGGGKNNNGRVGSGGSKDAGGKGGTKKRQPPRPTHEETAKELYDRHVSTRFLGECC